MRGRARTASLSDVCRHFACGAGLGAFLALSLIVANKTIFGAISNSSHPRLYVIALVACTVALMGIGSAISGFILTSLEKNR